jgi:transposase InsO family protein
MDLVGPARVCSAGGKWYVLVILRLKNDRHGDVVRAIRSDNGSEFKNSHFETFCHDLGLEHQFSSTYVACQNAVVQRKNRSLCDMARTMLMSIGL